MPKIIIFTDFDGTLSGREGGKTVFGLFYQSLLNGDVPGVCQDYRKTPLKDSNTVQNLFEVKFGPYSKEFNYDQPDADLLLSSEAVEFLHNMLNNDDVSVQIITRNRQDYIRALLTYQGFNPEELNKLGIFDSVRKDMAVQGFLSKQTETISTVYVLDDSSTDYNFMVNAVTSFGFTGDQIKKYHKMPGCFEWGTYQKDIHKLVDPSLLIEDELIELASDLLACEVAIQKLEQMLSQLSYNAEDNSFKEPPVISSQHEGKAPKPSFFNSTSLPKDTGQNTDNLEDDVSNTP
jgi:2-hydroxy-3-keto-5-methylthiopentenyl-1-phosphate phosphatase